MAARAIHKESGRQGAFVVVDCANIPRDLLQSELFGVEKGAYTDAKESRDGLWQRAKGGTLFLDEVHQLTLEHQARLLRAIETGEIRPVGKTEPTKVDARVIAATNCNLQEMVRDGTFRADLYFRLHYLIIETPPLRHHLEDLPILANHFWRSLTGDPSASLPGEVLEELAGFDWLGNNRDLHGALTTLFAMVGTSGLSRSHVRAWLKAAAWASEGGRGAPPDVRALEQYPNECARHLRRADRVMRGAQIQVRDVMNGAPATEPVRHAIATSTMNCVQELELLCETPVLFHGKFEKVRAVKNHLRTFAHMFPERSDEALKFWKEKLEPAFSEAYAAIIDALDELHDAKYAADAARRRRRSREAGTGRPTDPELPRPLLR